MRRIYHIKFGWLLLILALVVINYLASVFHYRWDLTKEKRYTLSTATKEMLGNLDDEVSIDLFFKGEFPAGYKKLAVSVREFLEEMTEFSNGKVSINNLDPFEGLDDSLARRYMDSIEYFYGIPVTTLQAPSKVGDELTQKLVLPGAIVHYKDTALGVNLLKGVKTFGTEPEELAALYNAIEATLEYKFASVIQKASAAEIPLIGYALGNGETWGFNADDAVRTLFNEYYFDTVNLRKVAFIPQDFSALLILKPTIPFTDQDKLKIDQYVMNGGKVFWMIDNMYAEFDSLRNSDGFIAFDRGLNLEDILFRYGVRVNHNLLQDMDCDKLPLMSGDAGGTQQRRLVDWPFFPLLNGTEHPISKNLDKVRTFFPNTIDTIRTPEIKKTYLLKSSSNARILNTPAKIDFEFLNIAPDPKLFTVKDTGVAVLLEGKFQSLYKGRVRQAVSDTLAAYNLRFKANTDQDNKMIVVADGDLAMNQYSGTSGVLPMGYNQFIPYMYANKEFYTNCIEYLVNPTDILSTRAKEFTLRLLDPQKVREQRSTWQFINVALPVLLVIISGFIYQQIRKRKFAAA